MQILGELFLFLFFYLTSFLTISDLDEQMKRVDRAILVQM